MSALERVVHEVPLQPIVQKGWELRLTAEGWVALAELWPESDTSLDVGEFLGNLGDQYTHADLLEKVPPEDRGYCLRVYVEVTHV